MATGTLLLNAKYVVLVRPNHQKAMSLVFLVANTVILRRVLCTEVRVRAMVDIFGKPFCV